MNVRRKRLFSPAVDDQQAASAGPAAPRRPTAAREPWVDPADATSSDDEPVVPWTREQAEAWRARQPALSLWRLVLVQAVIGCLCGGLAWAVTGRGSAAEAAWLGAAVVVLPTLGMVMGLRRLEGAPARLRLLGFFVYEGLKVLGMLLALVLIAWLHPTVEWVPLVLGLVLCLKAGWVVLLRQGR